MNRRQALLGLTGGLLTAAVNAQPRFTSNPFRLGIASGDPSHDRVVLWTRLAPDPLAEDGFGGMAPERVPVEWRIASDEKMSQVVAHGSAMAEPAFAHSVHVEAKGLRPARWYWYQFTAGAGANRVESPIGRTRTAPAPGAMDEARFAVACCQLYDSGYYTAYQRMADEDLHVVLHIGDYIYEGVSTSQDVRPHTLPRCIRLADYRRRYALYKLDPDLQRIHALFPFAAVFDDHEVASNWAGEFPESGSRAEFLDRRAAAFQAYFEHVPLSPAARPTHNAISLYRTVPYGAMVQFLLLDTRQFRTDQPCGDGVKPTCPERDAGKDTILGARQERWLFDSLSHSRARWNAIAQQVILAPFDRTPGPGESFDMDRWDGYPASRNRLLAFLDEAKPANPIVLAGDSHNNWLFDLKRDLRDERSPVLAPEFDVTSISSGGDGADQNARLMPAFADSPHLRYHNARRGYLRCRADANSWTTDYRVVPYISKPGAPIQTAASFIVENGRPSAQKA